MVQVIINNGFLKRLVEIDFLKADCIYLFFRKLAPYDLIIDVNSDDLFDLQKKFPQLRQIATPQVNYKFQSEKLNLHYIKDRFVSDKIYYSRFFLLDISSDDAESLRSTYNLFFSNADSFEQDFNYFFNNPDRRWEIGEMSFGLQVGNLRYFETWDDLTKRITPSSFYLISDRYCLENAVDYNLAMLIGNILAKLPSQVIPTFVINANTMDKNAQATMDSQELESLVQKHSQKEFKIRVLKFPKWLKDKNGVYDHSRFIASNYFFLKSDDSFNYFKPDGIKRQAEFNISDHFIFSQKYGHYFISEFYLNLNKLLKQKEEDPL